MRHLVAATFLVFAAGCAAQGLPLDQPGGAGSGGIAGGSGGNGAADMSKPLGGDGASCKTACDCEPGLACRMGVCAMLGIGPIYCCDSSSCPQGSFCQTPMGGFGQCGSSGGGGGGFGGGPGGGGGGFGGGGGGFGGGPGGGGGGFGGGPGGGGDGGIGMFCQQVPCGMNPAICKTIGCGPCRATNTCGN